MNGDGRITSREFVVALPKLDRKFTEADAAEIFDALDRDKSGSIDYRELEQELRRDARSTTPPELRAQASKSLKRVEMVVVLGVPTRAKKALRFANESILTH